MQKALPPSITNSTCNNMMRNMYPNATNRQYQYTGAMNNAMNGIGRYAAAQMSSMSNMAAAAVNSPYSSMAAQFSSLPNSNSASNMNLRQVIIKIFNFLFINIKFVSIF